MQSSIALREPVSVTMIGPEHVPSDTETHRPAWRNCAAVPCQGKDSVSKTARLPGDLELR